MACLGKNQMQVGMKEIEASEILTLYRLISTLTILKKKDFENVVRKGEHAG